tara:strand:+ start:232 stop:624 length:393 start_codon:yes stop_codon:yes gene_type:complete
MQERHFIQLIHQKLPPTIYKWKINDAYHGGVPDCFYSGNGGLCFVEYKYKKELPKKDSTCISFKLTLQQCAWLKERKAEGVPCYVALGVGKLIMFTQKFEHANKITKATFMKEAISISEFVAKLENLCVK